MAAGTYTAPTEQSFEVRPFDDLTDTGFGLTVRQLEALLAREANATRVGDEVLDDLNDTARAMAEDTPELALLIAALGRTTREHKIVQTAAAVAPLSLETATVETDGRITFAEPDMPEEVVTEPEERDAPDWATEPTGAYRTVPVTPIAEGDDITSIRGVGVAQVPVRAAALPVRGVAAVPGATYVARGTVGIPADSEADPAVTSWTSTHYDAAAFDHYTMTRRGYAVLDERSGLAGTDGDLTQARLDAYLRHAGDGEILETRLETIIVPALDEAGEPTIVQRRVATGRTISLATEAAGDPAAQSWWRLSSWKAFYAERSRLRAEAGPRPNELTPRRVLRALWGVIPFTGLEGGLRDVDYSADSTSVRFAGSR